MEIYNYDIVFQEVPDEISLCISVCGCNNRCDGCHSEHLWNKSSGYKFDIDDLRNLLNKYNDNISCVCFMGGEWYVDEILVFLDEIKARGLKSCLYTGSPSISDSIRDKLTYLKIGEYIEELGGLNRIGTNQRFIKVDTGEDLTYKFIK